MRRSLDKPYYAVIFSSLRTDVDDGYDAMDERMSELAAAQPGFLGVETARGADGTGITVSYWESEDAVRAWKRDVEHLDAQRQGRDKWYSRYEVRVARVEREYRHAKTEE